MDKGARNRLVDNIVESLHLSFPELQSRCVAEFKKVYPDFGSMVEISLKKINSNNFHL